MILAIDLPVICQPISASARRKEANPQPKTDRTAPKPTGRPDQHAPQSKPRKGRAPREARIAALIAQGITSAKELAARLRCEFSTIYRSAAFRAGAGLEPIAKPVPRPRPQFVRCPGCRAKAKLLKHGYCRACDTEAHVTAHIN